MENPMRNVGNYGEIPWYVKLEMIAGLSVVLYLSAKYSHEVQEFIDCCLLDKCL